jgi:hypothetical protein
VWDEDLDLSESICQHSRNESAEEGSGVEDGDVVAVCRDIILLAERVDVGLDYTFIPSASGFNTSWSKPVRLTNGVYNPNIKQEHPATKATYAGSLNASRSTNVLCENAFLLGVINVDKNRYDDPSKAIWTNPMIRVVQGAPRRGIRRTMAMGKTTPPRDAPHATL